MTQRVERRLKVLPEWGDVTDNDLSPLAELSDATLATLQVSAEQLRKRAGELERLADGVHVAAVCKHLVELTGDSEQKIDMLRAALWIARLDNRDLDVEAYVQQVDRMGQTIIASLPEGARESEKLAALNAYLFRENGFHGSRTDYYHRANSYLDRVIDDREGLPITLSILYIELGRQLGLNIVGVGLPGHFVVRHEPKNGDQTLIDTFAGAVPLSRRDAELKVLAASGVTLTDEHLATTGKRAILLRVLTNLLGLAEQKTDRRAMLRYLEAMVAVDPQSPSARGMRAVLRRENQRYRAALQDLDWFLEHQPPGIDLDQIRRMRTAFEEKE
jgi:regulator of sirC expression with transglutaminase-like and TPR domain